MQDWIELTDVLDGHRIGIRFGSIRTLEEVQDQNGRTGTVVATCGANATEFVVSEPIARIFELMDQNAIAVHGNDYGFAGEHAH